MEVCKNSKKMCLFVLLLLFSMGLYSTTYYVSNAGNDANNGSIRNPWLTIHHALLVAQDSDIIMLREGTYQASEVLDKNITIKGYESGVRILPNSGQRFIFSFVSNSQNQNFYILHLQDVRLVANTQVTNCVAIEAIDHDLQIENVVFDGFTQAIKMRLPYFSGPQYSFQAGYIKSCDFVNNGLSQIDKDFTGNEVSMINVQGCLINPPYAAALATITIENNSFNGANIVLPISMRYSYIFLDNAQGKVENNSFNGIVSINQPMNVIYVTSTTRQVDVINNSIEQMVNADFKIPTGAYQYTGIRFIDKSDLMTPNSKGIITVKGNKLFKQLGGSSTTNCGIAVSDTSGFYSNILENVCSRYTCGLETSSSQRFTGEMKIFNNTAIDCTKYGFILHLDSKSGNNFVNNLATGSTVKDVLFVYHRQAMGNLQMISITHNAFYSTNIDETLVDNTYSLYLLYYTCILGNIRSQFTDDGHPVSDTSLVVDSGSWNKCGDPELCYWDDLADQDPDGTVKDIGCYPYIHSYDMKNLIWSWNWIGFPRVRNEDGTEYLSSVIPPLTSTTYMEIKNVDISTTPPTNSYSDKSEWDPWSVDFLINRIAGYKVFIQTPVTQGEGDGCNRVQNCGYLIDPSTRFPLYTNSGSSQSDSTGNWVNYFVRDTQNIVDAFGSFISHVKSIKAEDWYYQKPPQNPRGDLTDPYMWSTSGKNLTFGHMYIVHVDTELPEFFWHSSGNITTPNRPQKTEYFTYEEKADYETVEVTEIDSIDNIREIGVFEGETCVGATKVDQLPLQILCYTDRMNRDSDGLTIQVYTGDRSVLRTEYVRYSQKQNKFINEVINPGEQESSIIKIMNRVGDSEQCNTPVILSQNYPNPFRNTTKLCFYLPKEEKASVSVYNIKGELVRKLSDGLLKSGKHNVIWDGKNDTGQKVAAGVYLYRLEASGNKITKKLLYLK